MPNHYLTIGLCSIDNNADEFEPEMLEELNGKDLCKLVAPMPESLKEDWYTWCNENWGTKWGTYGTEVKVMGGDGSPILISFVSAWCPPNAATMLKIEQYLKTNYHIGNIIWTGHDPYDGRVEVLKLLSNPIPVKEVS